MALISSVLASGLATVFAGTDSFAAAGAGWASAYTTYAQGAQANGVIPVFTGLEEQALSSALQAAFAAGVQDGGASTLAGIEAALIAFWLTPPILFGLGTVTLTPPGLGALISATLPANILAATPTEAASNIANALDIWTHTITVTFPGPLVATLL